MIRRRRFVRDRNGRVRPGLEETERALLRALPTQARGLVDREEPSARRLFPVAYPHDAAAEAEYGEMLGASLLEHHHHVLDTLAATVDASTVGDDELNAWLAAVEVLRLLLGTQLDLTEEMVEMSADDPRADQFTVYQYLSMLQGEIVDALSAGLARGAR